MNTPAPSFLMVSSSFLQLRRTCLKAWMRCLKAWMSLNFDKIPPPTTELEALECLNNQRIML